MRWLFATRAIALGRALLCLLHRLQMSQLLPYLRRVHRQSYRPQNLQPRLCQLLPLHLQVQQQAMLQRQQPAMGLQLQRVLVLVLVPASLTLSPVPILLVLAHRVNPTVN